MILLILKLKNQECVCMLTIVHPFEIKFIETFFNGCSPVRIFHSNPNYFYREAAFLEVFLTFDARAMKSKSVLATNAVKINSLNLG